MLLHPFSNPLSPVLPDCVTNTRGSTDCERIAVNAFTVGSQLLFLFVQLFLVSTGSVSFPKALQTANWLHPFLWVSEIDSLVSLHHHTITIAKLLWYDLHLTNCITWIHLRFASAKKCSNEGRALMQLDFQQYLMKLERLTDLR